MSVSPALIFEGKFMNKIAKLSLMTFAILSIAVFSGCGGGDDKPPPPPPPTTTYTVTVSSAGTGATGGGNYVAGATVSINAGTPPAGQQFRNWTTTSSGVTFANVNSASTTFTMPANAVTVTARFDPISAETYTVTVSSAGTGATGGGNYAAGDTVNINAGTPPAGQQFKNWTTASSGVTFANASSANTTFTMPANAVTVTANFESLSTVIEIWTPADMNNVRNNLSGNYILAADISLSSYSNWTPIGSDDDPFTGKINGNGKKISGLKINSATAADAGLFGYVEGGEIIDFTLVGVDIDGGGYTGAIAGVIDGGTITGCSVSGIIASSSSDFSSSGGIVGSAWNDSVITDCHSAGEITASHDAGGIAGSVYNSRIINSSSSGDIVSSSDSVNSTGMSGGIAGYAEDSHILSSFSSGKVVSSAYVSAAGGIAGGLTYYSVISNSYSTGDVESSSDSNEPGGSVSGGIAGYVWYGTITDSYSAENIISSGSFSGGIAGSSEGDDTIVNSVAINSKINAAHYAGRIIGYIYFPASSEISDNFAWEGMTADGIASFNHADIQLHGIDKAKADLKLQPTYSDELGWRFGSGDTTPWQMPAGGYPILYWQ